VITKCLLQHSLEPATSSYCELDNSSPCHLSSHLCLGPIACVMPDDSPNYFEVFRTLVCFKGEVSLAPHPTPKQEDHPLLPVHHCVLNTFSATLNIWRPFLRPQTEDAPCRSDRDPLITEPQPRVAKSWYA